MKKVISILILLVMICTVCIGFVACDDVPEINNGNILPPEEENSNKGQDVNLYGGLDPALYDSMYDFLKLDNQFSFGKISLVDESFTFGGSSIVKRHKNFVIDSKTAFYFTITDLQGMYDKYLPLIENKYSAEQLDFKLNRLLWFGDIIVAYEWMKNANEFVYISPDLLPKTFCDEDYQRGDYIVNRATEKVYEDMIHENYKIGNTQFLFASSLDNSSPFADYAGLVECDMEGEPFTLGFYTIIYSMNKDKTSVIKILKTNIMLYLEPEYMDLFEARDDIPFVDVMRNYVTEEERHQIAQHFQQIQKEILIFWINSSYASRDYVTGGYN